MDEPEVLDVLDGLAGASEVQLRALLAELALDAAGASFPALLEPLRAIAAGRGDVGPLMPRYDDEMSRVDPAREYDGGFEELYLTVREFVTALDDGDHDQLVASGARSIAAWVRNRTYNALWSHAHAHAYYYDRVEVEATCRADAQAEARRRWDRIRATR